MRKHFAALMFLVMSFLISIPAVANDWVVSNAHVTLLQAGSPGFDFQIDAAAGPCAAGSWITFNWDNTQTAATVQVFYNTLLTAVTSGHTVNVYGFNPDSSGFCQLEWLHITNQGPSASVPPVILSGNCISGSNPGQSFILNGVGQTFQTNCTFAPPQSSSDLRIYGTVVTRAGTITQLVAKQVLLSNTTGGGTVQVWVNPNSTSAPFITNLQCSVNNNSCVDSQHQQAVNAGDRVIIIVTPPSGASVGPVSATLTIS